MIYLFWCFTSWFLRSILRHTPSPYFLPQLFDVIILVCQLNEVRLFNFGAGLAFDMVENLPFFELFNQQFDILEDFPVYRREIAHRWFLLIP